MYDLKWSRERKLSVCTCVSLSNETSKNLICLLAKRHNNPYNPQCSALPQYFFLHFLFSTIQPLPLRLQLTALDEFLRHWGETGIWAKPQHLELPVEANNPQQREVATELS